MVSYINASRSVRLHDVQLERRTCIATIMTKIFTVFVMLGLYMRLLLLPYCSARPTTEAREVAPPPLASAFSAARISQPEAVASVLRDVIQIDTAVEDWWLSDLQGFDAGRKR